MVGSFGFSPDQHSFFISHPGFLYLLLFVTSQFSHNQQARLGKLTWLQDEVFPYFKISGNFTRLYADNSVKWKYHSEDVNLNTGRPCCSSSQLKLYLEANKEHGAKDWLKITIASGRRDHGKAFMKILPCQKNLKVVTQIWLLRYLSKDYSYCLIRLLTQDIQSCRCHFFSIFLDQTTLNCSEYFDWKGSCQFYQERLVVLLISSKFSLQ